MGDFPHSQVAGTGPVRWGTIAERDDFMLPVGTVTVLLADIEAVPLFDEVVGRHGGVRPLEQGDGLVAAFARASDALECAVVLQGSLAGVGMTLHTGEVQLRDQSSSIGSVVDRAARLREIGHDGQVLVSRATAELAGDAVPLEDLGSHRLRDLGRAEHVFQVGSESFPSLRSVDSTPNNLPARLTTFIGREDELAQVSSLLAQHRLVTLTGGGGCGKTSLALQAAGSGAHLWPDGVWFCDLSAVSDPALVAAVAETVGVKLDPASEPVDTVVRHLRSRRLVVILDNCEHLVGSCAVLAHAVLQTCPDVSVLATSRESLRVDGEVVWRVPSLALPEPGHGIAVDALVAYDAVRLFVDRAVRVRPNFVVDDANAASVAQICGRLGGIPLAIELAAAMVRVMTPDQIAAGLDDRFRVLGAGPRTAVPRHQTLRASVDWSYDLLSDAERVLLGRLSVFAGGFTLETAEQICGTSPLDTYAVLPTLLQLTDKSLVALDDDGRYRMLETIRQYGAERLRQAAEQDALHDRHLDVFLSFVERVAPALAQDQRRVLPVLRAEHDNIRAALEWSRHCGRVADRVRLAGELGLYWYVAGLYVEGRRYLQDALVQDDTIPPVVRARALYALGLVTMMSDRSEAIRALESAVELARECGDALAGGRALGLLGQLLMLTDPVSAEPLSAEAEALARQANDQWGLSEAWFANAFSDVMHGNITSARSRALDAASLARSAADTDHVGEALNLAGAAALLLGDLTEAEQVLTEAIALLDEVGNAYHGSHARVSLAQVVLQRGDARQAQAVAQEALDLARTSGLSEGLPLFGSGLVALAEARLDDASTLIGDALAGRRAMGIKLFEAEILARLAEVHVWAGALDDAEPLIDEGLRLAAEVESDWGRARVLYVAGLLSVARGDDERAESVLHEALTVQRDGGDRPGLVDTLEALAAIASRQESHAEAARLFGAAAVERERMSYVRWPVRPQPSEPDTAPEWDEGRRMSVDEAVAYARRGRGERRRPSTGWTSLTPAEVEVVKLVAHGLSNPQIGEKLFISHHTVKVHLSHVFAKLGLTGRAELASEVTRRGL